MSYERHVKENIPFACCGESTKVLDSRHHRRGILRRRRECEKCGERWTTVEVEAGHWNRSLHEALGGLDTLKDMLHTIGFQRHS